MGEIRVGVGEERIGNDKVAKESAQNKKTKNFPVM